MLCLPAVACAAAWACLRPPAPSLQFAAVLAAVYALGITASRAVLLERQYQVRQGLRETGMGCLSLMQRRATAGPGKLDPALYPFPRA